MRRGFMIAFLRAGLAFNQRVVWYDDQFIAHLQVGIGAHVTVNSGTLWIKEFFQFVADAFADGEADNRFAMHDDKSSDALAVTLDNDFLDSAEALRGFHVDDNAPDQLTSFNHFEPSFSYFIYTLNSRSKNAR